MGAPVRVPPYDAAAERAVLGGILLDNDALAVAIERGVSATSFYIPLHRKTFQAFMDLLADAEPMDILTVSDRIRANAKGAEVPKDLDVKLAELAEHVPTAANLGFYARIVAEKASRRAMIHCANEIVSKGYDDAVESADYLDWAESSVGKVSAGTARTSFVKAESLVMETVAEVQRRFNLHTEITGVRTGLDDLDVMTGGLQPQELIILAARPGMGKTSLCLNVLLRCGVPGLIFSLEMGKKLLMQRLMASEGRIDFLRLRSGALTAPEWAALTQASARVAAAPLYIDDASDSTMMQIRAKARRWRNDKAIFPNGGMGIIAVDYLQMVKGERGDGREQNREREVAMISSGLKGLAKELDVPILSLAMLKRPIDRKARTERPTLESLRESGGIEADADVVLFLHKPGKRKNDGEERENVIELVLGKQRNGPTGVKEAVFIREHLRFENLSKRKDEA